MKKIGSYKGNQLEQLGSLNFYNRDEIAILTKICSSFSINIINNQLI